jgi:CheY-like chemotaxis protein
MRRRILLADDSVTIQKVIELTFLDEDYEVRAVSNGDEAIAALPEASPDFVIADVHMPGANGYEVCRRAKQLRPDVPVLLLVGTFEPFDEGQARNAGADSFLKKPFDSQELLQRVEELLASRAAPPSAPSFAEPFEPTPAFAEPSFSTGSGLDVDLPPLGGFEPAGFGQTAAPQDPEPSAEPVWSNFDLEPEPAAPSFTAPAAEPFDREPAFDLGPEPSFAVQREEPVFNFEDEGSFTLQDEVAAPDALSLEEPQDRYPAEPAPASAPAGFSWGEPAPEPWTPSPEPEPEPPVWATPAPAATAAAPAAHTPAFEAVEEVRPSPVSTPAANGGGRLSDEDVDRIARRVVELLGDKTVRDVAWEVIPDMAEVIIRDRLKELEGQVDLQ